LEALPAEIFKYQEGASLARWHAKVARAILDAYGPDKPGVIATRDTKVKANNVAPEIRNGQSFLIVDGMQIVATIEYILDQMGVDAVCIAQKAQNDPLVVTLEYAVNRYLESRGKATPEFPRVWMDTASAAEVQVAITNGFTPERLIVSHPRKTQETLRVMSGVKPAAFTFDSLQELRRVLKAGVCPDEGYQPIAAVRIKTSGYGATNNLSAKFGCPPGEALSILRAVHDSGFTKLGIAFHVGTQCCRPDSYGEALDAVRDVLVQAHAEGIGVEFVDIGGGFPDARKAAREGTTQQQLIQAVGERVRAFRDQARQTTGQDVFIVCEPGRIITDRGTIVTEVLGGDASTATMMRRIRVGDHKSGGLSGAVHDEQSFDIREVPRGKGEEPYDTVRLTTQIFGATGYPSDQFLFEGAPYQVPSNIRAGDHLVIPCTGSYSSSAGATSHGIEPPSPYMILGSNDFIRSPWASKNSIYLEALERIVSARVKK
jgi:ornithine decarboxylase